jgi:hypothetical protein
MNNKQVNTYEVVRGGNKDRKASRGGGVVVRVEEVALVIQKSEYEIT